MPKYLITFLFLTTLFTTQAKALSFVFEPVLQYGVGKFEVKYNEIFSNDSFKDKLDAKGPGYGARALMQFNKSQIGLEYMIHHIRITGGDVIKNDDIKFTEWGLFFGYSFFEKFRLIGVFVLNSKFGDIDVDSGAGTKVGFSYTLNEHIQLGLEYRYVFADQVFSKYSNEQIALQLSFPFTLD